MPTSERNFFLLMKNIYLWFYCLPIVDAVLLVLLATGVFLFLRRRFENRIWWKPAVCCLLALWLMVILWATLVGRSLDPSGNRISPVPFASYAAVLRGGNPELIRGNLMNVILFYPVGLLLAELLPDCWKRLSRILLVLAVCCLLSVGIEFTQYQLGIGLAETDDVLHNTLGGVVGAMVNRIPKNSMFDKMR